MFKTVVPHESVSMRKDAYLPQMGPVLTEPSELLDGVNFSTEEGFNNALSRTDADLRTSSVMDLGQDGKSRHRRKKMD